MESETLHRQDLREIYERWAQGTGPFECFVRKTNFVSLKHYPDIVLGPVSRRANALFTRVKPIVNQTEAKRLALIEAPAVKGLRLGWLLQTRLSIKPVLTFGNLLHPNGLVGGDRYVRALVGYGRLLQPVDPVGYAFILDSQRFYSQVSRRLLRQRFNNQYELTADDLPSAEMLKFMGYTQVVFIHQGDEKEDIGAYLEYLAEQQIGVEKILVKRK